MKAIVLGMGQQGKAVIHDLESSQLISEILAADLFPDETSLAEADQYLNNRGYSKTNPLRLDVSSGSDFFAVLSAEDINIVVCMLPIQLALTAARAALDSGIPFVSSNYTYDLQQLDEEARRKQSIILPEMGLDPGIDLVLGRMATEQLDVVQGVSSYGGGVPAPETADSSPIKYKVSWTFERVLDVYVREARFVRNGQTHTIPGSEIFKAENVHQIEFPKLGKVEAYANGDAERYVDIFGLGNELKDMRRYALRWPGHSAFWYTMVNLGLLDEKPINIEQANVSPRAFLAKCLAPNLQFEEDERDVALLRVEAWGLKENKKVKIIYDMVDYRDLETGLFAMNRTVGFTSSIAALMILKGQITQCGVLSPVRHVPAREFIDEITARGIQVNHRIKELE